MPSFYQWAAQELVIVVDRQPVGIRAAGQARHAGGDQRGPWDRYRNRRVQGRHPVLPDLPQGGHLQLDGVHGR